MWDYFGTRIDQVPLHVDIVLTEVHVVFFLCFRNLQESCMLLLSSLSSTFCFANLPYQCYVMLFRAITCTLRYLCYVSATSR